MPDDEGGPAPIVNIDLITLHIQICIACPLLHAACFSTAALLILTASGWGIPFDQRPP